MQGERACPVAVRRKCTRLLDRASDDLGRIYFVAEEVIEGAGPNSEEDEASEGEPNLYLLSADGSRIFFNSNDPLLPRDSNGAQDVYEWEAPGTGGCDESDPDFFPQNGGCLYLISSGKSPFESEFWEASPDGDDVFFTTESSLLPQDPGLIDLYDARVNGGFPQPVKKAPCEGEACQSPPPPPEFGTPSSEAFEGPGNPPQASNKKRRCPKGKRRARRKGKAVCVSKRRGKGQKSRAAGAQRRAQR